MRKATYAASFAVLLSMGGAASAADVYSSGGSMKDAPVYVPAPLWSGFYIGGNVGGAFGSDNGKFNVFRTEQYSNTAPFFPSTYRATSDHNGDEVIGGVHAGFNIQQGTFVYGLEGDADFGDSFDYLASIRGRIGVAMGSTLLFATGGAAFVSANTQIKLVQTDPKQTQGDGKADIGNDQTGFVVGAGFDHKIAPSFSVGVEGLYYSFDSQDLNKKAVAVGVVEAKNGFAYKYVDSRSDGDFYTVRARLTYHFAQDAYAPLK